MVYDPRGWWVCGVVYFCYARGPLNDIKYFANPKNIELRIEFIVVLATCVQFYLLWTKLVD